MGAAIVEFLPAALFAAFVGVATLWGCTTASGRPANAGAVTTALVVTAVAFLAVAAGAQIVPAAIAATGICALLGARVLVRWAGRV